MEISVSSIKSRIRILDIWVDPLTRREAVERVRGFLEHGTRPHTVFASNPEKNFSVTKNQNLYRVFCEADLLLPDGIGIVLAARILYRAQVERVPGSDFIFDICSLAEAGDYRIFLYGAKEEVNRKSAEVLAQKYPRLSIAGRANGYIKEAEMPQLIKKINDSKADILFVALGSPRQEKWFDEHKEAFKHVKVVQGIGGTLDTIAGTVKRAPAIWQRLWAEWLYRLLSDPRRFKRQQCLPVFAFMVFQIKVAHMIGLGKQY